MEAIFSNEWDKLSQMLMCCSPATFDIYICPTAELFDDKNINFGINVGNVKVKVTLVQALRLCTGRTAHRGSRVIRSTLS
jgi:hypothetical protein